MEKLVINQEYKDQVMSHGNIGAKSLKDYSQDDLVELAIIARRSGSVIILRCFKNIPSLKDLVEEKMKIEQRIIDEDNEKNKEVSKIEEIKKEEVAKPIVNTNITPVQENK